MTGEVVLVGSGRLVKMPDIAAAAGVTSRDVGLMLAGAGYFFGTEIVILRNFTGQP